MSLTAATPNYYELLDIPQTADQSQINQAYYRLVKRFDEGNNESSTETRLGDQIALLQEAFDTL